ncbi:MAG: cytochrome c oxidase assembly protein [Hyphomicrobiales bacterium]|nr:MAG: cytochrome c oxidase assembly protein [Hyphomicrobiales bacterium]
MNESNTIEKGITRRHKMTAAICVVFLSSMLGMAYAAVPLYKLFCQVTGYGGTTRVAEVGSDIILDREITIRFDANVAGGLPWEFKPVTRKLTMKIGELGEASYSFTNLGSTHTTGTSTFNVTPQSVGAYFNKLECFCFTEQPLSAGEKVEMPVVFFIDPAIADDPNLDSIKTITLSYTFFPVANAAVPLAQAGEENAAPIAEKL